MRVLIACESSGHVRQAFRSLGHEAYSCDLLPSDDDSPYHIQGDVLKELDKGWDLMIAHPPCTYLCNSGVSHLHTKKGRWEAMREGVAFFKALWNCDIPLICIENPIMHGYAKDLIGCGQQAQTVQPYWFGHLEQKATCLWLKGLDKLEKTNDVEKAMLKLPKNKRQRLHYLPPSADRWKIRSATYKGLASAMASQWG